jgi:alpha-glucosidase
MEQGVGRNKSTLTTFLADQLDGGGGDYWTTYYPRRRSSPRGYIFFTCTATATPRWTFSHETHHGLHLWQTNLAFTVSAKDSYIDLLRDLTALIGRQPPLPDYLFSGLLLGMQGGSSVCRSKLERMLAANAAVSAVWTQDWIGKRVTSFGKRLQWDWCWNREL